jgi:predicted DNA-binding transcriptional regulator
MIMPYMHQRHAKKLIGEYGDFWDILDLVDAERIAMQAISERNEKTLVNRALEPEELPPAEPLTDRIVSYVAEHPDAMTREIAKAMRTKTKATNDTLNHLIHQGRITREIVQSGRVRRYAHRIAQKSNS